jgi:hypothetical protein
LIGHTKAQKAKQVAFFCQIKNQHYKALKWSSAAEAKTGSSF